MGEFLRELLQWDSRGFRTLRSLALRPGFLTREYRRGRRVRYLPPLRLYLVVSVAFLFVVGTFGDGIRVSVSLPGGAGPAETSGQGVVQVSGSTEFLGPLSPLVDAGMEAARREPGRVRGLVFRAWSWIMFLLMPAFALLVALLFRKARVYYAEHLVFALHFHAYQFLVLGAAFLLATAVGGPAAAVLTLLAGAAVPAYLLMALRAVYREPWWKVTLKTAVLGAVYAVLVGVFTGGATLVTLISVA